MNDDNHVDSIRDHPVVVILTLLGAVAGLLWAAIQIVDYIVPDHPTVAEQLETIRKAEDGKGRTPIIDKKVELNGSGVKSHLFVFRRKNIQQHLRAGSDDIRIYDVVDNDLELKFRFKPRPSTSKYRTGKHVQTSHEPYIFRLDPMQVKRRDGSTSLFGAFYSLAMEPVNPKPVVIAWDDFSTKYVMQPLIDSAPTLRRVSSPGYYAQAARRLYRKPTTLKNAVNGAREWSDVFGVFGCEDYKLTRVTAGDRLLLSCAYLSQGKSHAESGDRFEFMSWVVRVDRPYPIVTSVRTKVGPFVRIDWTRSSLSNALANWSKLQQAEIRSTPSVWRSTP